MHNLVTEHFSVVGKRVPDICALDKVTGKAQFVSDIHLPDMLIAKILHSPHAHALIKNIDTSKAEKLPGVKAIATYKDAPQKLYTGTLMNLQSFSGIEAFGVHDLRVLDRKVRHVGDAVAAIAAVNEKIAEEAIELIEVDYEPLPAVFNELEAIKPGSPQLHDLVERRKDNGLPGAEKVENNLALHVSQIPRGDVEKSLADADFVIEGVGYTTQQKQAPLETFHCIATFDSAGKLTVWTPIQLPHLMKRMVSYIFEIPLGNIRIKNEYTGGGFGAGLCLFREPICIILARKTGKPVKLIYSRQEEFTDRPTRTSVGPYILKMGVKKDGTIVATDRKVITAAGSHVECSTLTGLIATGSCNTLYRQGSYRAEIDTIYTNKIPCGAMRGFGNPEETFVREQVMDIAAEKIGMDPLDFRLQNLCQVGDPGAYGPVFSITTTAMAECIKLGAEKIGWKQKRNQKHDGILKRGIGVSCMAHVSGAWPVHVEHSNAFIKFNEDASVVLNVWPASIGTNAFTSLAQVVAEVLEMPVNDVHVIWGDSDMTLFEIGSHASRTMYILGNAVKRAAEDARTNLIKRAAKKLQVAHTELEMKGRNIFVKADPKKCVTAAEVCKEAIYNLDSVEQIIGVCSFSPRFSPPPYQAAFSEVEVDTETGQVKVLKMINVCDSGRIINPMTVEGQMEGGTAQGLGLGLWEEPVIDPRSGRMLTDDFDTYKIASTLDMPEIETILIERPDPTGPFGAKGIGEPACVNQAASVANALYNATGIRIWSLPITPEKVLMALKS